MATDHIVKSYDEHITLLTRKILEMGGLVEQQIAQAIQALVDRDVEHANRVIERDDQIDLMEEEIDQFAIRLLATRQPMASDLRLIAMAMKISNDLERMGDYATNIAKRCERLAKEPPVKPLYHSAHGADQPGHGQGRARRLCRARYRQGDCGVAPGRRSRRHVHEPVPRAAHLHDGRRPQHLAVHRFDLRGQIWSGSAITPPTSPRRSTTSSTASASTGCRVRCEVTGP